MRLLSMVPLLMALSVSSALAQDGPKWLPKKFTVDVMLHTPTHFQVGNLKGSFEIAEDGSAVRNAIIELELYRAGKMAPARVRITPSEPEYGAGEDGNPQFVFDGQITECLQKPESKTIFDLTGIPCVGQSVVFRPTCVSEGDTTDCRIGFEAGFGETVNPLGGPVPVIRLGDNGFELP